VFDLLTLWNRFSSLPEGIDATPRGGSGFHLTPKSEMTIFSKEDGFGLLHQVKERCTKLGLAQSLIALNKADGKGRSPFSTTK